MSAPWHVGRTVGVTLYAGDGPADMVGVMVGPHDEACKRAEQVVAAVNAYHAPDAQYALLRVCTIIVEELDAAALRGETSANLFIDGPTHRTLRGALRLIQAASA